MCGYAYVSVPDNVMGMHVQVTLYLCECACCVYPCEYACMSV